MVILRKVHDQILKKQLSNLLRAENTYLVSLINPVTYAVRCTSWSYFKLDLGVQRTYRQSARPPTQPINGNNLPVDTSIRALQAVRLPPV